MDIKRLTEAMERIERGGDKEWILSDFLHYDNAIYGMAAAILTLEYSFNTGKTNKRLWKFLLAVAQTIHDKNIIILTK